MNRLLALALIFSGGLFGHPMGNFSISHYAGIRIERTSVELTYLIDMAEIPTFQEMQRSGITGVEDPHLNTYLAGKAAEFAKGLRVRVNGKPLWLHAFSSHVIFPPGAGNLPTMKFGFVYRAGIPATVEGRRAELTYRDANFPDRAGWKEIVATSASGAALMSSSVPEKDRSARLANYPTDAASSPPQDLEARIVFSAGTEVRQAAKTKPEQTVKPVPLPQIAGAKPLNSVATVMPVPLQANRQPTPRNAFTELMRTQQLRLGIVLLAVGIAASLGALHALEPGHGKTIVAAYLVGSKGTARDAILLGTTVTISHTAGVYLLGAITIYAQKYILPERLYPFLGVLSGILIAGMGFYLFLQRFLGAEFAHSHSHGSEGHSHAHGPFRHSHMHQGEHEHAGKVSGKQLLLLGITGGIVPCPAALVVLLSAIALRRVGFGLLLIFAFSIGLAAVLIVMGLVAVYAARLMSRLRTEGPLIQRWLPLASASMITLLGCGIAIQGLITAGILQIKI
ncbi:MAG: sulfite exporter TauE/SafE family protein [Acidobacteriaceae bacterium]|nr:sulfite exporter TauE/SafE family protein [Acidobacteriaceae bacterium]